jgi:surface protein
MDITSVYNTATLASMKASNDDYLANKYMYRELNTIRLKVLGQNNLLGTGSYATHQYTSVANKDYFGTLLQKLSVMFPDMFIYYTRGSVSTIASPILTATSVLYTSSSNTYTHSNESINNTIFISQIYFPIGQIDLYIGQIVFTYTGTVPPDMTVPSNIPFITATGVTITSATSTISNNTVTVTINTHYTLSITTTADYGLSFKNTNNFYNAFLNLNITTLTNIPLSTTGFQFNSLSTLSIIAGQNPIIRSGTSLSNCFDVCLHFNSDISGWDTSNVVNMSCMFSECLAFNQPIGSWNTSNVTNMFYMFKNAIAFNQPINYNSTTDSWNTLNVTNMSFMFWGTFAFNQPIGSWNTSNVTNMSYMFFYANAFNQPIGSWNTSNVTNMSYMFANDPDNASQISTFNQNIGNWDTSKVTNMSYMFNATFSGGVLFNNGDILGGTTNKMNWIFNFSPISTKWHLNSALTQSNAPTSLQNTFYQPNFELNTIGTPINATYAPIHNRKCWEIIGNTTITFDQYSGLINFVAVGGGQNSQVNIGGNGGGVVYGSFNITQNYTLTVTIGSSNMPTTIKGIESEINITANKGTVNGGSATGSKIVSHTVQNGGNGGNYADENINGQDGPYIFDLGIYVAGGGSVTYYTYTTTYVSFRYGSGGSGGGGGMYTNAPGVPNTGGGAAGPPSKVTYVYSGGSGVVYLYI